MQHHAEAKPPSKGVEIKVPLPLLRTAVISVLHVLAFIVDLVGFFLPLSFSPGSCTREEGFMVTLTINNDDP
jgi:hypothetical protein